MNSLTLGTSPGLLRGFYMSQDAENHKITSPVEASVSEMGARITLPGFTLSINLDNHTAYKGMWARTAREG